jgi:hypothetical protein
MLKIFREGIKDLRDIWIGIFGAGDYGQIEQLGRLPDREFRFPRSLWTRVVYDYALAYHKKKFPREHLLKSLTPLYLGKTASFVMETENMEQSEAESEIEELCTEFENTKAHLINSWK